MTIKTLRVIYDLQVGGVQRQLLRLLPLLRQQGVETEICCLKEEGDMAGAFRDAGFQVHLIPLRSRMDPAGLYRLRRFAQKNGFQIVHSHMYASNTAVNAAGVAAGFRIVNSYHSQSPFRNAHQAKMARRLSRFAGRIIAVSGAVRTPLLEAGMPEKKIRIVYNGVSLPEDPPPPPKRRKGEPLRLFWAGRFVKQKRPAMLIDLAKACQHKNVPIRLTMIGEGPLYEEIRKRVEEEGLGDCVSFTGWQKDISPSIRRNDLYVSASNREGFPNTLLEVCAQGRGFLVADIPPNQEVLGESGAGFCASDDMAEWAGILERLADNPEELDQLSRNARERVRRFSIENTAQEMLAIYEEALGQ